ncbi:MAG: dihydrodipicolinate synthase family protein [Planctomycetaceae bacterium]|nr:dihydrodipicolinate synthase family protein [Planctomycetaceae bacterium]
MTANSRLSGIFTPNLVPLTPDGQINEPELRRYVDWLIERGVHGLYPNGSTGEFTRFTVEERRRIVEIMVDQTRGRVPILAGAAEANVKETLRACEYYASLGVRAVAIVAPFYYKLSPASVYAYFAEIGRNTPVDVTLYNIPMFASPIDVPTVQRLSDDFERIIAIKDSSGDIPHMIRMITAVRPNRPDFSFLTGWDAALMPLLLIGCDGGTNASSGVVPELTRRLYDLTLSGQLDDARQIQYDLVTLFDKMLFQAEFPNGFRAAADLRGFTMGRGRQPLSSEQQADLSMLSDALQCLLAAHGFADQPVRGCSPGDMPRTTDAVRSITSSHVAEMHHSDDVNLIVQGVVAELRRRGMM